MGVGGGFHTDFPGSSVNVTKGEWELEVGGQTLCFPSPSLGYCCRLAKSLHRLRSDVTPMLPCLHSVPSGHSCQPRWEALVLVVPFPQPTPCQLAPIEFPPKYHDVFRQFLAHTVNHRVT